MGAPNEGDIQTWNGKQYRFNGGDHRLQSNWSLAEQPRNQTYSPQDRETQSAALAEASTARRQADLAGQFIERNRRTGTTGLQNILVDKGPIGGLARAVAPTLGVFDRHLEDMTTMSSLNNQMFLAQLKPGQSTMANTPAEAENFKATLPSVNNPGSTNVTLARELALRARIAEARTEAMDAYLKKWGSLSGFDAQWAPMERRIYQEGPGRWAPPRGAFGRGAPPPGNGGVIDLGVIK